MSFHLSSAFTPRFTFQHLLTRCDKTASCWLWDRIHASVRHAICDLEAPGWFPHLLPGSQIVVWHFVVCCFAFVSHGHTNLCNDLAKTMRWTEKTFSWRRLWYTGRTVQAGINIYELTFHATLTPVCLNSAVMQRTCIGDHVPQPFAITWARTGKKQVIAQAEMFPVLAAKCTWGKQLKGRSILYFLDNESARMAFVRCFSPVIDNYFMSQLNSQFDLELQTRNWYSRVPSKSNPRRSRRVVV